MTWTVTIDNGSTCTDGCLFADGRVWSVKVLTTPYDLMRCFVEVFRQLAQVSGLENEAALLRRVARPSTQGRLGLHYYLTQAVSLQSGSSPPRERLPLSLSALKRPN